MRKILAAALGVVLAFAQIGALAGPANAAAYGCAKPFPPWSDSGTSINLEGNAGCTSYDVNDWRAKMALAQEKVNAGPLPNSWPTVSNYTQYTRIAARGAHINIRNHMLCSVLRRNWSYKTKFWYDVHCRCGGEKFFGVFSDEAAHQC